jgi:hypothetical protein
MQPLENRFKAKLNEGLAKMHNVTAENICNGVPIEAYQKQVERLRTIREVFKLIEDVEKDISNENRH